MEIQNNETPLVPPEHVEMQWLERLDGFMDLITVLNESED